MEKRDRALTLKKNQSAGKSPTKTITIQEEHESIDLEQIEVKIDNKMKKDESTSVLEVDFKSKYEELNQQQTVREENKPPKEFE